MNMKEQIYKIMPAYKFGTNIFGDIEITVYNCDLEAEAREELYEFIKKIRNHPDFACFDEKKK